MKLNVFGRHVQVLRCNNDWKAYYLGNEGKRRLAEDIVIPSEIKKDELPNYLADLCHEWASQNRETVTIIS